MEALGILALALVMAIGLVATVIPVVPGLLILWLAGLAYAFGSGFDQLAWTMLAILTVLALAGSAASLILPQRGAAARGASAIGYAGAIAGAVLGAIVLPVLGLPIGGVLGLFVAERARTGDQQAAWSMTKGVLRGIGIGAVFELAAGVSMVLAWITWVLLR